MRDRKLDRLFVRFRRKGDAAALARVFDATASELLTLAVHLVRDVGEGEDLVQQTFLTAIEKADRYQADRRLMPWLVGILVRHAHNARRKMDRTQNDPLLDPLDRMDPTGELEESELKVSVANALSGLSATYRAVLEPYLFRGERAVDIARASKTSPGTVRVQIRRGLDELRRALPAGLALGSGVLLGGRSLANVRVRVLDQAAKVARENASLGAASVSSTTLLGGLAVFNKFALGALILSLVSLLGWLATGGSDAPLAGLDDRSDSALQAPPIAGDLRTDLPPNSGLLSDSGEKTARRVESMESQPESSVLELALSGATGRLIDEEGEPVAGVRVQLLEMRLSMLEPNLRAAFDQGLAKQMRSLEQNPLIDEARTDAEGRFDFWGANPAASHALSIDFGGDRPSLRVIDIILRSGEKVEIGDVQLEAVRTVTGQVVDFNGQPLAGARVRAASLPEQVEFMAAIRSDSWLLFTRGGDVGTAIQVPGTLASLIAHFPAPTTESDEQGNFQLRGVPQLARSLYIDREGDGFRSVELGVDQTDMSTIQMPARSTHAGRVIDASGQGIVGAQVLFGHLLTDGRHGNEEIVAQGETTSDQDGAFQLNCQGSPIVFVRRGAGSAWTVRSNFESAGDIVLPNTLTASVTLKSRDGEPVTGAQFHVTSGDGRQKGMEGFFGAPKSQGVVEELGEGEYAVSGLVAGPCGIRVLASGFALLNTTTELVESDPSVELQLDRAGPQQVRVLDAKTGLPVEEAIVAVMPRQPMNGAVSRGRTDVEGRVTLEDVPLEGDHQFTLRVTHPGYALHQKKLDTPGTEQVEIGLSSTNEALFRLTVAGGTPTDVMSITIRPARGNAHRNNLPFPLFQVSDTHGSAIFEHLPAGEWQYKIEGRIWNMDSVNLLATGGSTLTYAEGEFTVWEGQRTVVDVDIDAGKVPERELSQGGSIEGKIDVRSGSKLPLQVALVKEGKNSLEVEWQRVSVSGKYRFTGLSSAEYRVLVGFQPQNRPIPLVLAAPKVSLGVDELAREDVSLTGITFQVELSDEHGNPVSDAQLSAYAMSDSPEGQSITEELAEGIHRVTAWESAEYMLQAKHPVAGLAYATVTLSEEPNQQFRLQFSRGVMCVGEVQVAGSTYSGYGGFNVFSLETSGPSLNEFVEFKDGIATFELVGLSPGRYRAQADTNAGRYTVDFDLPEGGSNTLELEAKESGALARPIKASGGAR
ncbi:MAG TPA: sigma-70 family RNA polymerase sigma factor [Gemmatimonadetes bacterium]|nr:sigma-70 family RNA polymerase sigma factor [Gemmatimonadota bacterium]